MLAKPHVWRRLESSHLGTLDRLNIGQQTSDLVWLKFPLRHRIVARDHALRERLGQAADWITASQLAEWWCVAHRACRARANCMTCSALLLREGLSGRKFRRGCSEIFFCSRRIYAPASQEQDTGKCKRSHLCFLQQGGQVGASCGARLRQQHCESWLRRFATGGRIDRRQTLRRERCCWRSGEFQSDRGHCWPQRAPDMNCTWMGPQKATELDSHTCDLDLNPEGTEAVARLLRADR